MRMIIPVISKCPSAKYLKVIISLRILLQHSSVEP